MKNTFTPGPWHIGMNPGPFVYGPLGEQVADCRQDFIGIGERGGNARLIASAPDLLAALEYVAPYINQKGVINMVQSAIAKATGDDHAR